MSLEDRLRQLQDALRDFGPNSQHLLSGKNEKPLFTKFSFIYQASIYNKPVQAVELEYCTC